MGSKLEPTELDSKKVSEVLSEVLCKQGNSLYEQDKIDDAIICYRKSIELKDKNMEAYYNFGRNYFLKNDAINPINAWNNAKILNPNHSFKIGDFYKF